MNYPTDQEVGQRIEAIIRFIVKVCVIAYVLGLTLGRFVHRTNTALAAFVRLERADKVAAVQLHLEAALQALLEASQRLSVWAEAQLQQSEL